jgi:putative GTP pyrophosphokinase
MLAKTKNKILREYDAKSTLYAAYGHKLSELIQELLDEAEVSFHSVSFRRKEKNSLNNKLSKQGVTYDQLSDITDVCGLRVITYFEDDVKKVSEILEKEFEIDEANSSDKAESLDPDRFGYLSVHYVVSNGEERNKLTEYKRFDGVKAEIQVRSILQHAWAEIEHDLGYKSRDGIPRTVRRRFSRLAGLLELADQEFRTIREELTSYTSEVLGSIESAPADVDLNAVSLRALVDSSELVQRIDQAVAEAGKCEIEESGIDDYSKEAARLAFFGMATIDDVTNALATHEAAVSEFARLWLIRTEDQGGGTFSPGISMFYLAYVLALASENADMLREYVSTFVGNSGERDAEQIAAELRETYLKLVSN